MTPLEVLREVIGQGVQLEVRGGVLGATPPGRLPADLRTELAGAKGGVLKLLAAPRKAAYEAWETVLGDMATRWEIHAREARSRGQEPRWIDDEALMDTVREAIKGTMDATTLATALAAIQGWQDAWCSVIRSRKPGKGRMSRRG